MANLATVGTPSGTSKGTAAAQPSAAAAGTRPFIRAAINHREAAGYDVSQQMGAGSIVLPDVLIPAYGYLRAVRLVVTTTIPGAASTLPTIPENMPFSILQNLILQEPNGAQIHNFPDGWFAHLAQKYGGYTGYGDSKQFRNYAVSNLAANVSVSFTLRIPVEIINRDSLGSLPNQNSAAQFRLKLNLAALATAFPGGVFTTNPTIRVRAYVECWDQPEAATDGMANQTTPPAMNTTQFWSVQQFTVNGGFQNIKLTRVGNYIRNLIFVLTTGATPTRLAGDANWGDPTTLYYDTRPLDIIDVQEWQDQIGERYGYVSQIGGTSLNADAPGSFDNSVRPLDFCHEFDGTVGHENRDQWLKTLSSTRLELGGTWGASGQLYVLTNDVVTVGNVFL